MHVYRVFLVVFTCWGLSFGESEYGFQKAVVGYPQRLRELLPSGFPQEYIDFYIPGNANSKQCKADAHTYLNALNDFQPWAVKMLDASSKIPSGLMFGHLHDLGNFDECLHVTNEGPIKTQHCMVHFPQLFPVAPYSQNLTVVTGGIPILLPELMMSICLPASCTEEDVYTHYSTAVSKYNATVKLSKFDCTTRVPVNFDLLDIFGLVFVLSLVTALLAATILDVYLDYTAPKNNEQERSMFIRVFTCFSILSNGRQIISTSDPNRSFSFINGIRFLSISWILICHHYYINSFFTPSVNMLTALEAIPSLHMAWLINGPLSVDTFFVISGCLLAYIFFNANSDNTNFRFNIIYYYLHRYIRLAPVLLSTILMSATLFNYIGEGPLWNHFTIRHKGFCRKNWWTNIIFLNNYINIDEQCASFTWFLCVDMQLYILSPLILLPMRKYKFFSYTILPFLTIAAIVNSFFISFINEAPAGSLNSKDLQANYTTLLQYTRAQIRIAPWLVGIGTGYILHKIRNQKFYMSKLTVTIGWVLGLSAILTAVYGISYFYQDDYVFEKTLASFYTAIHRTLWALGIAWIIFACETGYGGPLRKFLSWSFFQPLGKLTFCLYIVHSGFQYSMVGSLRGPTFYSFTTILRSVFGELVVCVILAFVTSLLVETPFRNLENVLLKDGKGRGEATEDHVIKDSVPDRISSGDEKNGISIPMSTDFSMISTKQVPSSK